MTTKTKTPEALQEQAEKLRAEAASIQAEIDAQSMRAYELEQAKRAKADQDLVDNFSAADLDADVDRAYEALRQAVTESPVVQAHARFLAAQYTRNHAHLDLLGARGRLGLTTASSRPSGTTEIDLDELITTTAQREGQRMSDEIREAQRR